MKTGACLLCLVQHNKRKLVPVMLLEVSFSFIRFSDIRNNGFKNNKGVAQSYHPFIVEKQRKYELGCASTNVSGISPQNYQQKLSRMP